MPVYLRNFYFKKLVDQKEKENKETEKATKGNKSRVGKFNPSRFKR